MIKLSIPHLAGNEKTYVDRAIESTWIVPLGPMVDEFEHRLEKFLNVQNVVALSAGTAAIHLGLVMAGVKRDDEVICQDLTFSASCNPIVYLGARPVFVDSERDTWNMDPVLLEHAIKDRIMTTGKKPAAIVPVHLYGMPAKMDRIMEIAMRDDIPVVEDAAEALGSTFKGRCCGTFGNFGALSFNGNKIITTSGGGALICRTKVEADRVKYLSTQAREPLPYYYHTTIGYNYRLSNVSAAIGCAQIEELEWRVNRRRAIHDMYVSLLAGVDCVKVKCDTDDRSRSNFWLSTLLLDKDSAPLSPDELRVALLDKGIETRLLWRPMHMQPVFADAPFYGNGVCEDLFGRGLCLPSGSSLTDEEVATVAEAIKSCLSSVKQS